jgi:hypothetical protein
VTHPRRSDIPEDVVAKRLADLADVDKLMRALREVEYPADRVHEKPPERASGWVPKPDGPSTDRR